MLSPKFGSFSNSGGGGGGGGGASIVTPSIAYVETTGDDATAEIGNPAKPFETAQAAYDAIVALEQQAELSLGVGGWDINLDSSWSSYCQVVRGRGGYDPLSTNYLTRLTIYATPSSVGNADGVPGRAVAFAANDIDLRIYANGGGVVSINDSSAYTGGAGGQISITGGNASIEASAHGGDCGGVSEGSMFNGGVGGTITLNGLRASGTIGAAGMVGQGGGSDGAFGELAADDCDLRLAGLSEFANRSLGRCSYPTIISIEYNKGGNAAY